MTLTVVERLIDQQGIRIERIAVALDLSNAGVRMMLAQKTSPKLVHIQRLCKLLGVGIQEIVGEDGCWRELIEMEDGQGRMRPVLDKL